MARFLSIVLLLAFVLVRCKADVHVSVYYDVQPFENRLYFREHDLKSLTKSRNDTVTIDFIPYGNVINPHSSKSKQYLANKFHACVLAKLSEQESKIDFVDCGMKAPIPISYSLMLECAERVHVQKEYVYDCLKYNGDRLMEENRIKTEKQGIRTFPAIIYDN